MNLTIRRYQPTDHEACRACVVELQDAEREIDPRLRSGESIADAYLAQMHVRCHDYAGSIFVAEHDHVVVGLLMLLMRVPFTALDEPPGEYALIAELVVRTIARRHGVGRALLRAAERLAADSGASELRIGVMSGNVAARELYLRDGFAPYTEMLAKPLTTPAVSTRPT